MRCGRPECVKPTDQLSPAAWAATMPGCHEQVHTRRHSVRGHASGPLLLSVLQDPAVVIKEKGELLYEQRTVWEAVVLHEDRRSS